MIIATNNEIAGYEIAQVMGLVRGGTVRARNVVRDIFASWRGIVGGEIVEYTKLQAQAREQALQRMLAEASALQADAVVGVRIMTSLIAQGASEILIYGTAVKLKPR